MAEQVDMMAKSSDHVAMEPYWDKVDAMLGGADAVRAAGETYLPRFPAESDDNYRHRLKIAKFTNIFGDDILPGLASKPFTKEVGLVGDTAPSAIKEMVEDIDGAGNHLSLFAQGVFYAGIAYAIDWIWVGHTDVPDGATVEQRRAMKARAFWARIPAKRMLAVYSAVVSGKEEFVYARIDESSIERDGVREICTPRVRVVVRDPVIDVTTGNVTDYAPARFELWEQQTSAGRVKKASWVMIGSGPISIGVIPIVPFVTGRRSGLSWRIDPVMRGAADLQIEHYQDETNLKCAKELTAFPVRTGNGVTPPVDPQTGKPVILPIGPGTTLYAPMGPNGEHGEWGVMEPAATSLAFLSAEIDKTESRMRELGRMPLTAGTAGLTQVAAAFASQKSASAVQAWAWLLKDALERAFKITVMWLNESAEPEVYVNTDFAIEIGADKAPDTLLSMHERKAISTVTLRAEMKRRSILSPEFDDEVEDKLLEEEIPAEDVEDDLRAAGGFDPRDDDAEEEPAEAA